MNRSAVVVCWLVALLTACASGAQEQIMVLQTSYDLTYHSDAQLYQPPPAASARIVPDNFGLSIYSGVSVAACDGLVYVSGGTWGAPHDPVNLLQIYDPSTGRSSFGPPMRQARWAHSSACLGGQQLVVCGGYNSTATPLPLDSCESYSTVNGSWSWLAPMPSTVAEQAAVVLNQTTMYIIGGSGNASSAALLGYDADEDSWTELPEMIEGRSESFGAIGWQQRQLVVCGGTAAGEGHCELYDAATSAWTRLSPMLYSRTLFGMLVTNDQQVLIFGGRCTEVDGYRCPGGKKGAYMTEVEEYDVSQRTSRLVSPRLFPLGPAYASVLVQH